MDELTVLEYKYAYAGWYINPKNHQQIYSERKEFSNQRRAVDDYHLCGVYEKAKVPYEVHEITGNEYAHLEPHEAIPLSVADACKNAVEGNKKILISSGYCALAPAIAGGIQQALEPEKRLGIIWIDAHSDNLIVEKTDSQDIRFVGFPLSTIVGQTMDDWRKNFCRLERPCSGENVLISDARCSDVESLSNLKDAGINLVSEDQFDDSVYWKKRVDELSREVDAIFLMVDVDILKSEHIPAYFRKEPGGHDVDTVMNNIQAVMETGKVLAFACFCVDFDKYEQGGDLTYLNSMRLIGAGLEAWAKQK